MKLNPKIEDIASDGRWSDSTKSKNRNALRPDFPLALGSSPMMKITRHLDDIVVGDHLSDSAMLTNENTWKSL